MEHLFVRQHLFVRLHGTLGRYDMCHVIDYIVRCLPFWHVVAMPLATPDWAEFDTAQPAFEPGDHEAALRQMRDKREFSCESFHHAAFRQRGLGNRISKSLIGNPDAFQA